MALYGRLCALIVVTLDETIHMAYPKAPTAAAASRMILSWSISARTSGRRVALLRGWRSFWTAVSVFRAYNKKSNIQRRKKKRWITVARNIHGKSFYRQQKVHNSIEKKTYRPCSFPFEDTFWVDMPDTGCGVLYRWRSGHCQLGTCHIFKQTK